MLQFGPWYKMRSNASEKEDSDIDCGECVATKKGEGKKKAVFEIGEVPLQFF